MLKSTNTRNFSYPFSNRLPNLKVQPKHFETKLWEQDNIQSLDDEEKMSDDNNNKQNCFLFIYQQQYIEFKEYNRDEVAHARHFLSIIDQFEQHIQESFLYQSAHAIVCSIIMAILIYLVLEEKFSYFYITIAFLLGVGLCLSSHYYTMMVAKYGIGQFLLLARKNTAGTISFGYESGIAVISFFLGLSIWLLAVSQKIYLMIYGEKTENYQKIFVFLYGGAAFGYATVSFFYKIGGSLYSSGSQIASSIFQSTDKIKEHSLDNPAVFVNRMGEYFSEFQGTFTDISSLTMFALLVLQIMISDSQELLKFDVALYFSMFFLLVCFLCSFISWIIGYFVYEHNQNEQDEDDEQKTTANYVRLQILVTQALALIVFGLFAFLLLPESFQLGYSKNAEKFKYDEKKIPKKAFFLKSVEPVASTLPEFLQVTTTSATKVKNWQAFICLISGSLNSLCLFSTFEYFTSHYYKPVRSMLAICEDDSSLAVLSSDVIGTLPQIIILLPLIISMIICQYIAGFFGLALFTLAFLSLIYTLQGVSTLSAFSQMAYKIGLVSELYGSEKYRVFGIRFAAVNYQIHSKQSQVIGVTVVAFASIGAYSHYMNIENGLKGNVVGLSGLFVGVILISLLRGSMLALTQYLSIQLIYWYRLAIKTIKEQYVNDLKPDHSATIEDLSKSINLSILMLFLLVINYNQILQLFQCNVLVILLGLLFGTNFILGLLLGLILTSAYFIIYSLIAGSSIINAKFFLEDKLDSAIPEKDPRNQALKIANRHAYSYKDTAGSSLLLFIFFIVALCLLAAPLFDKTGWISKLIEK